MIAAPGEEMLEAHIKFIALDKLAYPLVNQFYKQVYKKGLAKKNESVFVLKDRTIVCSAKLKTVGEQLLLTGVASTPVVRGRGYASYLIKKILAQQSTSIYCFPYKHLLTFYQQLGFIPVPTGKVPEEINKQFASYNRKQTLLLMFYPIN